MPRGTPKLEWTSLRVRTETRGLLEEVRHSMLIGHEGGSQKASLRWNVVMTIDDVILALVKDHIKHRERRRKSQARAKARRRRARQTLPNPGE